MLMYEQMVGCLTDVSEEEKQYLISNYKVLISSVLQSEYVVRAKDAEDDEHLAEVLLQFHWAMCDKEKQND